MKWNLENYIWNESCWSTTRVQQESLWFTDDVLEMMIILQQTIME